MERGGGLEVSFTDLDKVQRGFLGGLEWSVRRLRDSDQISGGVQVFIPGWFFDPTGSEGFCGAP